MQRDWWVYSTAVGSPPSISVIDPQTKHLGMITEFSQEEWEQAFFAPSRPYRWHDPSRVIVPERF